MSFRTTYPFDLPLLDRNAPFLKEELYMNALKQARVELAELKGYCQALPNPMLLLSPAIVKESLASSEIENIHTTVEDVLRNQLLADTRQSGPEKEVLRYREAILWGFGNLERLTLSSRLILGVADTLTMGKYAQFRSGPNALTNSASGEVIYTPPPAGRLPELVGNWERFVSNQDDGLDPLIKAAAAHYQFEAIHPFGDGNGRTGRILLVLQLIDAGILDLPVIYISGYINANKPEYYRLLKGVTEAQDWQAFIFFILKGLELQARNTKKILLKIMELFRSAKTYLKEQHKDLYTSELVELLFYSPILTSNSLSIKLGIHRVTASKHLNKLVQAGFLQTITIGRNHFFIYRPLLDVLQSS